MVWLAGLVVFALVGFATWSLTLGQSPGPSPSSKPSAKDTPAAKDSPSLDDAPLLPETAKSGSHRDPSTQTPLQQQVELSAIRGAEWLCRMGRVEGRFVPGHCPALNLDLDGEPFLRQAGAAFALARSARLTADERHLARATQAVVLLCSETTVDPQRPQERSTALPSSVLNRVASASFLILAINELPAPQKDLLDQSEQLCNYLRRQQRTDGSLTLTEDAAQDDEDSINVYSGPALYALMRSQQHRPATWKTDLVRQALKYYGPWWKAHKNLTFVPSHTAAYTEAFLLTKEQAFADLVTEMNDWLCGLQYDRLDLRHPDWWGGFMSWQDGRAVAGLPDIRSAAAAESLAEVCRVTRQLADATRFDRYRASLELALQFLTRLQYTPVSTRHFADWYRPQLLGGFHASPQDGNLSLEYTQHAIGAMVQYVTEVAAKP
jgi:hypothetical protein